MSQAEAATIYARRRSQVQEASNGPGAAAAGLPSTLPSPERVYAARRAAVAAAAGE